MNDTYRSVKKRLTLLSLAGFMAVAMIGCGDGGDGDGDGGSAGTTIAGQAVNGPFVKDSVVTLKKLDSAGEVDAATAPVEVKVLDDLGNYLANVTWDGATDISVTGKYFDTESGELSASDGTMQVVTEVMPGDNVANVTTITTVAASRIKKLLKDNVPIAEAQRLADVEVARDVLQVYNLPEGIRLKDLNPLDGETVSEDKNMLNAQLLSFDMALDKRAKQSRDAGLGAASATGILVDLANDMKADGGMNVATDILDEIKASAEVVGVGDFAVKLTAHLSGREPLPAGVSAPKIPTAAKLDTARKKMIMTKIDGNNYSRPVEYMDPNSSVNDAPGGYVKGVLVAGDSNSRAEVHVVDPDVGDMGHTFAVSTQGSNGTFSVSEGGVVTYSATAGDKADKGIITITDPGGLTGTVTVLVAKPAASSNNIPTVLDGNRSMALGEQLTIDLSSLSADTDTGDPAFFKVSAVSGGTVHVSRDIAVFKAAPGIQFVDGIASASFKFLRSDGIAASSMGTVTITINEDPVAPAPTVDFASISVGKGQSQTITVTGNDLNTLDTEANLTFGIKTAPSSGNVVQGSGADNDHTFVYTAPSTVPSGGKESFVLSATDLGGNTGVVSVEVTVLDLVPPSPVATFTGPVNPENSQQWLSSGEPITVAIAPNDANSGDTHTFALVGDEPVHGVLTRPVPETSTAGAAVNYVYTPTVSAVGDGTFTIQVTDQGGLQGNVVVSFSLVETFPAAPVPVAYDAGPPEAIFGDSNKVSLVGNGTASRNVTIKAHDINTTDTWTFAVLAQPATATLGDITNNNDGSATFTVTSANTDGAEVADQVTIRVTDSSSRSGDVVIPILLTAGPPAEVTVKVTHVEAVVNYGMDVTIVALNADAGLTLAMDNEGKALCTKLFTATEEVLTFTQGLATQGKLALSATSGSNGSAYGDLMECKFTVAESFGRMPVEADFSVSGKEIVDDSLNDETLDRASFAFEVTK